MTTAQVVETSVTVNNNSPIQDYVHPDDQTQPFEIKKKVIKSSEFDSYYCFGSVSTEPNSQLGFLAIIAYRQLIIK